MTSPALRALLLALPLAVAGCLSTAPDAPPDGQRPRAADLEPAWYERALAHDPGHNHSDLAEHLNASTPNFHLLGHEPLLIDALGGKPAFNYGCGDAKQKADGRRLAVVNGFMSDLAFALVDVTDPAKPFKVGEYYSKGLRSYDAALTPDGNYVVLAFTGQPRVPGGGAPTLAWRTACASGEWALGDAPFAMAGPDAAVANGVVLVDVSAPEAPAYADYEPTPGRNVHSVSTAEIDGETWIMVSVLGGVSPGVVPTLPGGHFLSYVAFDQIEETPLGPKLVRVATVDSPPVNPGDGDPVVPIRNGHVDAAMQRHPIDGKVYAYIADWEGGVITVDMSNPRAPVPVGFWRPPSDGTLVRPDGDGPCYLTAVHEAYPIEEVWDGRHYYLAGQECPGKEEGAPGGSVFIVDNTDPASPQTVGEWHLPADTGVWEVIYQASPHYVAVVNRTLFVSSYHAGLWAVDLSTAEKLKSPPSVGVYLPDRPPAVPPDSPQVTPNDEQVTALPDGTLVLIEQSSGVYVLRFDETDPAPPAPPYDYGASG
ncbi:MAG TPA: hypothetical protein VHH36_06390 [Candidatus Thermoplasmatota archaeon]|nr:hypothetical protein [Candidatus Thermoplasmatota archaeon]